MTVRYRLWLDGNGRPSVVECIGAEPDPAELEHIRTTIRNTAKREGTLIIGPDWEVRAVPQAEEILRRIEGKLDRQTTWSGMYSYADGRPITVSEKVEMDRHEQEIAEALSPADLGEPT